MRRLFPVAVGGEGRVRGCVFMASTVRAGGAAGGKAAFSEGSLDALFKAAQPPKS